MMKTKRATQPERAKTHTTELPAWATEKRKVAYCVQTEDPSGEHIERVDDLTIVEYTAIKLYLAQMRGLRAAA